MVGRLGIIFDVYGTIVLTDCAAKNYYTARRGFRKLLKEAKRKGYGIGFFGDDDKRTIDEVLARAKIQGYETHYGNELDENGLKKLSLFKFTQCIYVGDMPRDLRAAEKYQVPFIKVPPFVVKEDKFDFGIVFELANSIFENRINKFAQKHKLKKVTDGYVDKSLRIKFGKIIIGQFF